MIKLTVKNCYKLKEDFENVFISKSGINVTPNYDQLKLASRSISSTRYEDVYIIEPNCYYYLDFEEDISSFAIKKHNKMSVLKTDNDLYRVGLLMALVSEENRLYIYNATQNIIYIEKGATIGEVMTYG